ncbi:uncharacterized protein LOC119320746 [Triticum dicoccoides]|uniref:uncharacterized protein LOC119320746 n=1 Tax=Triticum dicoccoides TaxID=85692 RepID=UPI0018912E92|nr:uncharacterized protein LOC119320746 [Triticum dicoccoides]XP_044414623.1 uncharacterized protein LOC123138824 [Triticum aestivum]
MEKKRRAHVSSCPASSSPSLPPLSSSPPQGSLSFLKQRRRREIQWARPSSAAGFLSSVEQRQRRWRRRETQGARPFVGGGVPLLRREAAAARDAARPDCVGSSGVPLLRPVEVEVERIVAAGVGEAAGGGAEDAGEREEAGERVRRERGGRVNLAVEEEALDRVREEPAHVVEEGDGSSAHSVPGAGAMWVRSVHLCFRHGSLALLAW